MTDAAIVAPGVPGVAMSLVAALMRGAVSALAVAALLWVARRFGRQIAGLLTGLPIVSGPALVWLAHDRGLEFAAGAAAGSMAAGVPCALFALTCAHLAPRCRRRVAVPVAGASCMAALWLLGRWGGSLPWMLAAVATVCTLCLAAMPRGLTRTAPTAREAGSLRAGLVTVWTAGVVSGLASLSAKALGPQWAGMLSSLPLVAAAIVFELHRTGCNAQVQDFLRGYIAGLFHRSAFCAVFSLLLVSQALLAALAAALTVTLLLGWGSLAWAQRRSWLAPLSSTPR